MGLKWIYKTKFNVDESVLKHKAQLVTKGYSQLQEIYYDETFSHVARMETVRLFVALVASHKWEIL